MTTLKNAQDLDRSNRMKDLSKGFKDPDELAQHRRRENKKHVEQSVEERQKVPEYFVFKIQLILVISSNNFKITRHFSVMSKLFFSQSLFSG